MASFELLMPIAGAFQHLGQTLTSARRLKEITQCEPDVIFPQSGALKSDRCHIDFKDVSFSYPDSQSNVLNNINLSVNAGDKLAILGKTGSGKSTLIQLLCRYWDVSQGLVSIAGTPLRDIDEPTLRDTISVVSQRVDILNGSLRDNLHMAKPTASDTELEEVLCHVGLQTLLEDAGLDNWLGDGGRQLSGGEKRRIGIARALLRNAPIMLLDEPTEGLDKGTEQQIMALLNRHTVDKTVIFITHRLVNLSNMDHICLIEAGQIVESGTHQALLNAKGRYHQLHQTL
jgi:ATP-binding cassette subfamily C protein CydC